MDDFIEKLENNQNSHIQKPLLKWAGGKTQILSYLIPLLKQNISTNTTYIEPFLGSGSVAIALNAPRMILNDKNEKLINFHEQVRLNPKILYEEIQQLINRHNKCKDMAGFYYTIRKEYNALELKDEKTKLLSASMFWFLNKTGFNGMYRETKNGDFNIPFGDRKCPSLDFENVMAVSKIFKKCIFFYKSFEEICVMAKKGDIIYLDPPYIPLSKTSSFNGYLKNGFELKLHQKLCKIMNELELSGVNVVMSNSDCDLTRKTYSNLNEFNFKTIDVRRFISGKAKGRRKITELIITNVK